MEVKCQAMQQDNQLQTFVTNLCIDLNVDNEIATESIGNYHYLLKHYILEGNQLHWLAIAVFVNCKKNCKQNPISLTRLLKNVKDFHLLEFFDKLNKWMNMLNLPSYLQDQIKNIEHEFNISTIIFDKYWNLFEQLFVAHKDKLNHFNFENRRHELELNQKYKQKKLTFIHLYELVWTIYSLLKTIYPLTSNDLISSFHLLLASNVFVYELTKTSKLFHLIKHSSTLTDNNNDTLLNDFADANNCSLPLLNCLIEQHMKKVLFERIDLNQIDENKYFEIIRQINNRYDEVVLTNCFIDQRIFIENSCQLADLLNNLNENRNQKSMANKTPLTAQQHFTLFNCNSCQANLTPISQANQLIQLLQVILDKKHNLRPFVCQQTYLDELDKRLDEYQQIFLQQFQSDQNDYSFQFNQNRFQMAIKLFFITLQNIFLVEKKRFHSNELGHSQAQQTFQKLILTNEFTKSLFCLCLLLVLYSYGDFKHDLTYILNLYSLDGYSLLKIIQIFLKNTKEINQSRVFIKYLSSIEESILSSMIFQSKSLLWRDIQTKGILPYKTFVQSPSSPNYNLVQHFQQSPLSHQIKRKLFDNSSQHKITRTQSDQSVERSTTSSSTGKSTAHTMFYKKLYSLVSQRIHLIAIRLCGNERTLDEQIIWNLFLFLFENYIELLFKSRHLDQIILLCFFYAFNSDLINNEHLTWSKLIQIYKTMPNSNVNLTRSVFIRANTSPSFNPSNCIDAQPCLTPSKPAGTIHLIDQHVFGDIKTFYEQVFMKIDNIQSEITDYFQGNPLIPLATKGNCNENQPNHLPIHCGKNLFVDYSSKAICKRLLTNFNHNENRFETNQSNSSNNILSSSVQVSNNNTVQTTTTRTSNGKFLTTISTTYNQTQLDQRNQINHNNNQILFGQTTFSQQFNYNQNHLNSLTKQLLQIENDRQSSSFQS